MKQLRHNKRGMILILVLACLAVASMLMITGVKMVLARHQLARSLARSTQAGWLAESGLERAKAQLAVDPKYPGETWNIPADIFGGHDAGVVKIEVKPDAGAANRRMVSAEADFPDDPQYRTRYEKELTMELP
jgi:Tfp pilus assembly protein PilX